MGSTKIGQLAQEMSATNPWWRDTDWESRDADLQAAEGHGIDYQPEVLEGIQRGGLYLLRGPRRVGKTVSLKRKISELLDRGVPPTCVVRAAVDGWAGKDVRTLVQNTTLPPMPEGQTRWWFLDEISATTGQWDRHVKWLRDNHHEFAEACVVLTGSDAGELTRAAGTLAGRRGQIRLSYPARSRTETEHCSPWGSERSCNSATKTFRMSVWTSDRCAPTDPGKPSQVSFHG